MKTGRKIILLFFLLIHSVLLFGQEVPPFKLYGSINIINGNLDDTKVSISKDGKKIKTLSPNLFGKYEVELDYQHEYTFTFSKPGYVEKSMIVNTNIPEDKLDRNFKYKWDADVRLFKQYEGINFMVYTQPVQKIYYNERAKLFEADSDYNKMILSQLQAIEEQVSQKIEEEKEEIKKAEEEAKRIAKEEEARKLEEERIKQEVAEKARREAEEAEKKRQAEILEQKRAEKEAAKKAAEEARKAAKEEAARQRMEEEARRKAELEERKKQEAEARKKEAEELARKRADEAAIREKEKKEREEEAKKIAEEARIKAEQERLEREQREKERLKEAARLAAERKKRQEELAEEREEARKAAQARAMEAAQRRKAKLKAQREEARQKALQGRHKSELALKYPPGKNVEVIKESYKTTTRVIISTGTDAILYRKVEHSWGGIYYFKGTNSISHTFYFLNTGEL